MAGTPTRALHWFYWEVSAGGGGSGAAVPLGWLWGTRVPLSCRCCHLLPDLGPCSPTPMHALARGLTPPFALHFCTLFLHHLFRTLLLRRIFCACFCSPSLHPPFASRLIIPAFNNPIYNNGVIIPFLALPFLHCIFCSPFCTQFLHASFCTPFTPLLSFPFCISFAIPPLASFLHLLLHCIFALTSTIPVYHPLFHLLCTFFHVTPRSPSAPRTLLMSFPHGVQWWCCTLLRVKIQCCTLLGVQI